MHTDIFVRHCFLWPWVCDLELEILVTLPVPRNTHGSEATVSYFARLWIVSCRWCALPFSWKRVTFHLEPLTLTLICLHTSCVLNTRTTYHHAAAVIFSGLAYSLSVFHLWIDTRSCLVSDELNEDYPGNWSIKGWMLSSVWWTNLPKSQTYRCDIYIICWAEGPKYIEYLVL